MNKNIFSAMIFSAVLSCATNFLYAADAEKDLSSEAKVIVTSSVSGWGAGTNPQDLFSKKNVSFAFHTNVEKNPYIVIELKNPAILSKVIVTNRIDNSCKDRAKNLELWLSEDYINWRKVWSANGNVQAEWTIPLDKEKAKFIRLSLNDTNAFHLAKVKILGRL